MGANYKELTDFTKKLEQLNNEQREAFIESCCKELAARLLRKVIKRTDGFKNSTGNLRRGWTGGVKQNAGSYVDSLTVKHNGTVYQIDIVNDVDYAVYVEYGHRTRDHKDWVEGKFMLTTSEEELRQSSQQILEKKLNKFLSEVVK